MKIRTSKSLLVLATLAGSAALLIGSQNGLSTSSQPLRAASDTGSHSGRELARKEKFSSDQQVQDVRAELAKLQSEIAALKIDQSAATRNKRNTQDSENIIDDGLASDSSPEEASREANFQVQEQQNLIESVMADEMPDEAWSGEAEAALEKTFQSEELEGLELTGAQCRSSLCRIELTGSDSVANTGEFDQNFQKVMHNLPWPGAGFAKIEQPEEEGGLPTAVVYIAREGSSIPATDTGASN